MPFKVVALDHKMHWSNYNSGGDIILYPSAMISAYNY